MGSHKTSRMNKICNGIARRIPYGILALSLFTSSSLVACSSTVSPNPERDEYVQTTGEGTLDEKLGSARDGTNIESENVTIIQVDDLILNYKNEDYLAERGTYGYSRQLKLIVARSSQSDQLLTFIYLGNRPFGGGHAIIYYRPVLPGSVITNNDIIGKIISSKAMIPPVMDFAIEGYYGSGSINGITGSELPEGGVLYLDE